MLVNLFIWFYSNTTLYSSIQHRHSIHHSYDKYGKLLGKGLSSAVLVCFPQFVEVILSYTCSCLFCVFELKKITCDKKEQRFPGVDVSAN